MDQPEAYVQFRPGLIDESYTVIDETLRTSLQGFVDAFPAWTERHAGSA